MNSYARIGTLLTAASFCVAPAFATTPAKPETSKSHTVKHETKKVEEGKDLVMTGRVVAICDYATGTACTDHAKCAECIKNGGPCALETAKGMIILGHGHKGCGEMVCEHAAMEVKVKGKMYEKNGIRYMDVESCEKMGATASSGAESKKLSSATESHRNVKLYPPGELSKMKSKSSTVHTSAVAMK